MRNIIILAIGLLLAWPSLSLAEVVGHLTQVEGRVELLKGGKLPAVEVKAQDGVEPGDVLRTKSLSRAQITFLDNTTVTISPEARIAIEEYMFDPAKGKRSVVMQLFQGLAHFVVSQVYKVQEPDFIVKTHSAAMGVRGTDVGIRLTPNDTTILNFQGVVRVANIFPEVGRRPPMPGMPSWTFKQRSGLRGGPEPAPHPGLHPHRTGPAAIR
ncbi:MAG: FecR family protein [Deltaproteobacteria bacterium]|nr:FecR family protein [Deltaproteobacteria bacterium]